jgi:hypothetical protein
MKAVWRLYAGLVRLYEIRMLFTAVLNGSQGERNKKQVEEKMLSQ